MSLRTLLDYAYKLLAIVFAAQVMFSAYFLVTHPPKPTGFHFAKARTVSANSLQQFLNANARWLDRHMDEHGALPYMYDPIKDRFSTDNQLIRQWFATITLGTLYQRHPTDYRKTQFLRNVDYNLDHYFKRDGDGGYFLHKGRAYLATNATAARALAIAMQLDEKYRSYYRALIHTIDAQLDGAGRFTTHIIPANSTYHDKHFAPGAAMVALAQASDLDEYTLPKDRLLRATNYYYHNWQEKKALYGSQWLLQGLSALWFALRDDITDAELRTLNNTIYLIANHLLNCQITQHKRVELVGAFGQQHCQYASTAPLANAVRIEGLLAAYKVAHENEREIFAKQYYNAALLALRHVLHGRINQAQSMQYKNPTRMQGSIITSFSNHVVRIDAAGHSVMAVDAFLENIGQANDPQPFQPKRLR